MEKAGVTFSQLYKKIAHIESDKMLTKDEAACLLAYEYKISLKKYFGEETIRNVRAAITTSTPIAVKSNTPSKGKTEKIITLNVGSSFEVKEPLLPPSVINDAKKMAEYYPLFYMFENSIRNFINLVMASKYGNSWWSTKVAGSNHLKSVDVVVQGRKLAENEHRFHGKRGAHEIYYTDLEHLKKIIEQYFSDFKPILNQEKSFYDHMLRIINLSRRIIAHNNPLTERDFNRIRTAFADWCDQLGAAKSKLSGGK